MKKLFLLLIIVAIGYSCEKEYTPQIGSHFDQTCYIRTYNGDTIEMIRLDRTFSDYFRYVYLEDKIAVITKSLGLSMNHQYAHPTNT